MINDKQRDELPKELVGLTDKCLIKEKEGRLMIEKLGKSFCFAIRTSIISRITMKMMYDALPKYKVDFVGRIFDELPKTLTKNFFRSISKVVWKDI
jgi:hypothetical protein